MADRSKPANPLHVDRLVESEHRAGRDLAWLVVAGVALCAAAMIWRIPDRLLDLVDDTNSLDVNGLLALLIVVPLGASVFAWRRYRDAVGAQHELAHLSMHDALTRLPNRRHLRDVLPEAFTYARRQNTRAAVMFIDLDGFKAVNDTYGHELGDRLMAAVGDRLRRIAEPDKWAARYAGDEFVVIDPAPSAEDSVAKFAASVVEMLEAPFQLGEDRVAISASIGIAFGDVDADPDQVLRDADVAMYDAKRSESRVAQFDEVMRSALTPATAARRLGAALDNGEFRLLYQPIVALRSGRMIGAEALLRWDDPSRGLLEPPEFLDALEETGLIVPVGRWVMEEACRQARRWAEIAPPGRTPLRVTLNVSPRQLAQSDFVDDLRSAFEVTGVDPNYVYLELSEATLVAGARASWAALRSCRDLGVGLALDNFGSGSSSINHLRDFDLELLKLDRAFTAGLKDRPGDATIFAHLISLARSLGIATLAEGVNDEGTVDRLLSLGCELGQGHHFSEALPATIIDNLVEHDKESVTDALRAIGIEPDGFGHATVVVPDLREATVASPG